MWSMSSCGPVLVVGGGRWARTVVTALTELGCDPDQIGVVSASNAAQVTTWGLTEHVWADLDQALRARVWSSAVVANRPAEHYPTAQKLLARRIATLVEKPFTPTVEQAREIIALADDVSIPLWVGHELTFLDDLERLHQELPTIDGTLEMWWHEHPTVHRDGTARIPDLTTSPIGDYLPHLLSILPTGASATQLQNLAVNRDGAVDLALTAGTTQVAIQVSRQGPTRRGLRYRVGGESVELDLAGDPPRWSDAVGGAAQRPLQRELSAFLDPDRRRLTDVELHGLLEIVRLTEEAERALAIERRRMMADQLRAGVGAVLSPAIIDVAREALALPLVGAGMASSVKDAAAVERWAIAAWRIVERLADDPFARATDLRAAAGADEREYSALVNLVADWDAGQECIASLGRAEKYWSNTIGPLLSSGAVHAVRTATSLFPLRIGIYPGLSCMFHCSFCGRNPDARYDRASVEPGYRAFVDLFDTAPRDDPHRFYISGGLEPLTNPRIGDIVAAGAERGFSLSLYTNALMLTPTMWRRQPGLARLDVLRVSLYGTDAASALAVTQHRHSFDTIIENVIGALRHRESVGSDVRVGFNHVILAGRARAVDELIDLIERINHEAGTARGLDFLTLREDYSAIESGLSDRERDDLRDALIRLGRATLANGRLPGLAVDLGYALDPLLHGWPARPLDFAGEAELMPWLYPQVSVAIDVLGDVYGYREAAFLDRPGGARYIIGRVDEQTPMAQVVDRWVDSRSFVEAHSGDVGMLDLFDHVVTLVLERAAADTRAGFPPENGPIRAWRDPRSTGRSVALAHPFPAAALARAPRG